jgi:hypothetical protein
MSVLNNCTLSGNGGGAEECVLNNCVITNNTGGAFGGILNNCLIVSNTRSQEGWAGAYAEQGYPIVLNNCLISNNVAVDGGGVNNGVSTGTPGYYTNCILSNCVLVGNSAANYGGGAYDAELNDCLIISNKASFGAGGGGAQGGLLNNCVIVGNSGSGVAGFPTPAVLNNCTLLRNSAQSGGGALDSILNNCLIISNSATDGGGVDGCSLTNCILADNTAPQFGGGAYHSTLVNCTVTSNSASTGGGVYESKADNSILYYNSGGDFSVNTIAYPLNYCCTPQIVTNGLRNITNAPLFVNPAANDFHLQANSPCINSGNNAYITTVATDLDGNPRIAGGTVDIGAYEYQTPTSVISYAYLQQYGLPTDGSADFTDLDGTAFNVYQDWVAGLNPTNPASILAMFAPSTGSNAVGIAVSWQSVSGILYNLQRSTNLTAQPPFTTVQTNITGQAGTTTYTDSSATSSGPYFYRVNVVAP